ncbi:retrovirus-related pol polyprotein from transposon TNT 1-94 [Tanacetum coccineum]
MPITWMLLLNDEIKGVPILRRLTEAMLPSSLFLIRTWPRLRKEEQQSLLMPQRSLNPRQLSKKIKGWTSGKRCKTKSPLKLVDEPSDEGVPVEDPAHTDEEADLQRALELSLKEQAEQTQGPAHPVVLRDPDSGKYQPLPEAGLNPGEQDEGQAGPNPGIQNEGLAGSNPGDVVDFTGKFFVEKPHEEESGKMNAETEVQSMVSVPIHQDTSSVPPMTTLVIDLTTMQSDSPLPTSTATTSIITTTTSLPPPPQPQQSTADPILVSRIGELEQHMADLIQNNLALEERLDKQGTRLYNLENLNIPHKVSQAVDEIVTDAVD